MKKINPKLIEVARDSRRITQKGLSDLLPKYAQQSISKIEKGEIPVSESDIENIAKVLDYPVEFFYQSETKTPFSNMYFRKRATLPVRDLNKIFAEVKIVLKSIDYLLEEIEIKEYARYVFDLNQGWTTESIATRLKEILELHYDKPVKDIITKIENLGIIVFFYDSPHPKFDGLTAYTDSGVPVIFVDKNMSNDRIKFTVVHELVHLVSHIPCDIEPWRNVEDEANAITSELYLPAKYIAHDLKDLTYSKLGLLKSYWGISKSALIRRAKDLDKIKAETYRYLNIELGRRNERIVETGYVEIDNPKILSTALNLLKSELGYSNKDLAKRIFLNLFDYTNYFESQKDSNVKLKVLKNTA